jgi:hypothetical protein
MSDQNTTPAVLATLDPEIAERLVTRRDAIVKGATASSAVMAGLRMASVPVALAALSRDAFGQTRLPAAVVGVLNFALTLEYLEAEFYNIGTNTSGLIPTQDQAIFTTIQGHENDHVTYLQNTLGASARPKPAFDFTAGNGSMTGPFQGVFTNYEIFKAVAQAFEDTGVRAYKGQAPALIRYPDVLTAALTIHSVEARHAAEVRRLRGNFMDMEPNEGWITLNNTDIAGTEPVYAGEENTIQAGLAPGQYTTVSAKEVSEAFDEPLTMAQVLAIVDPFIV